METTQNIDIIERISQVLHEEKWTRTMISQYTLSHFKELEELFQLIINSDSVNDILKLCEDYLQTNKNSIAALYFSGMISLLRQSLDDSNLVKLINLLNQNQKSTLVEHLCNTILKHGEHRFALKSLLDLAKQENNETKILNIEERLVKVDLDDAETTFDLAQKYEKAQNLSKAIEYYKKAIHRFLLKKNFPRLKDSWDKLLKLTPKEFEYFMQIENKVSKSLDWDSEKSLQLLEELYEVAIQNENYDQCIEIQQKIFKHEGMANQVRRNIVEVLKKKYADNPKIDEIIRLSGISQSYRNLDEGLRDFYKHLSFAKGNFVYHNSWGVGIIKDILEKEQEFIIDFEKKRQHRMAQKMAVEALMPLQKDDIRVLIATTKQEELKKKIKDDIEGTLKTIMKSFGNRIDFKTIRAVLTPSVLTAAEWSSWSSNARKILKKSPEFAFDPEKPDTYLLRSQPISYEEKAFSKFRGEKDFYKRVEIFYEILEEDLVSSDYFSEIYNYYVNIFKSNKVNDEVVSSFLLLQLLNQRYSYFALPNVKSFKEIFEELENPEETFSNIKDVELKKMFLKNIRNEISNWPSVYSSIFLRSPNKNLIDELLINQNKNEVKKLFKTIIERFREYKDAMLWLAKFLEENNQYASYEITQEKVIINLLNILELSGRDINNNKDINNAKRYKKIILNFLFKENVLEQFIQEIDQDKAERLLSLIRDNHEIPATDAQNIKDLIYRKFSLILNKEEGGAITTSKKGLLTTRLMFNQKSKELTHLVEVEIPKNSKEIGDAMALGDLKENAEYHAAKERQGILNATVSQLSRELEIATVIDPSEVETSKIGFGTKITLLNLINNQQEVFTILGPWESQPEKNIISYLSPIGERLLGRSEGETLKFTINDRQFQFQVLKIEKADFS